MYTHGRAYREALSATRTDRGEIKFTFPGDGRGSFDAAIRETAERGVARSPPRPEENCDNCLGGGIMNFQLHTEEAVSRRQSPELTDGRRIK